MGKYHPHGDARSTTRSARMAPGLLAALPADRRPRQLRLARRRRPPPTRYTECAARAARHAACSAGIDEDTVDFGDNYDGEDDEPVVLPARFPNLLVNGSQGIAVGMATNIPPHNLGEVIDATVAPASTTPTPRPTTSCSSCKGPDFPTGALILGRQRDPRRLPHRARARSGCAPSPRSRKRPAAATSIVVTELPYQTSVERRSRRRSRELVNDREHRGHPRRQRRVRRATTPASSSSSSATPPRYVVLNNLYKHTPMQTNFAVNMVALVDGVPRTLNLRDALQAYVDHQVEVIRRRSEFRLAEGPGPGPHRRGPAQGARHDRRRSSP